MNKWLFHLNGLARTSLSATVTRVSNFVLGKCVCVVVLFFLHCQGSPSWCIQSRIVRQVKYVNRNALSMFKALNKVLSKNAQFYF